MKRADRRTGSTSNSIMIIIPSKRPRPSPQGLGRGKSNDRPGGTAAPYPPRNPTHATRKKHPNAGSQKKRNQKLRKNNLAADLASARKRHRQRKRPPPLLRKKRKKKCQNNKGQPFWIPTKRARGQRSQPKGKQRLGFGTPTVKATQHLGNKSVSATHKTAFHIAGPRRPQDRRGKKRKMQKRKNEPNEKCNEGDKRIECQCSKHKFSKQGQL